MMIGSAVVGTAVPSLWYMFQEQLESAVLEALADPLAWSTSTYVVVFVVEGDESA